MIDGKENGNGHMPAENEITWDASHKLTDLDLSAIIEQFRPDLVIIDPSNAAARDEKARNYQDTFNLIRQVGSAAGIRAAPWH